MFIQQEESKGLLFIFQLYLNILNVQCLHKTTVKMYQVVYSEKQ